MPSGIAPPFRRDATWIGTEHESSSIHTTKPPPGRPRRDGDRPAARRAARRRPDDDLSHAPRRVPDAERDAQRALLADGDRDELPAQHADAGPRAVQEQADLPQGDQLNPALQNGALGGTVGSEHA